MEIRAQEGSTYSSAVDGCGGRVRLLNGDPEAYFIAGGDFMIVGPEPRLIGARNRVEGTVRECEVRPLVRMPSSVCLRLLLANFEGTKRDLSYSQR